VIVSLMNDSVTVLQFLYRNGPIGPEMIRALELRCFPDTISFLETDRQYVVRDQAGQMNLHPMVRRLCDDLEGNLKTFPPQDWLFQFPLADQYRTPELFLAMPFDPKFDVVRSAMEGAATAAGFVATRGDDTRQPGTIMHQVWEYIRHADAVVADVTGRNANVLYEAGMAHALGKPVVLLLQDDHGVPFDIAAVRQIRYRLEDLSRLELELGAALGALPKLPYGKVAQLEL